MRGRERLQQKTPPSRQGRVAWAINAIDAYRGKVRGLVFVIAILMAVFGAMSEREYTRFRDRRLRPRVKTFTPHRRR